MIGDVKAGGSGYFYVRVPAPGKMYRATVQSFDNVAVEAPMSAHARSGRRPSV